MVLLIITVNIILIFTVAIYIVFSKIRKQYFLKLGDFQKRLNVLVDFTDFLALNYGSVNQQAIYLKSKLFNKSIRTLSDYWYYIDSVTSSAEIFILNAESDGMEHRDRLLAYIAQTKSALASLNEKSQYYNTLLPWFSKMIVKIPADLNNNSKLDKRIGFIGNAVGNLTLHKNY